MTMNADEFNKKYRDGERDFSGSNLREADLYGANLYEANLYEADLYGADLREADLYGADLRGANLRGANLYGANWGGFTANTPSGQAILTPTQDGWHLQVGCWSGTIPELRALIAGTDWPEAEGEEQDRRRPILNTLADMCDAHIAYHTGVVDDLAERWGGSE